MSIVAVFRLILHVGCVDGDTALLLFRCLVYLIIFRCLGSSKLRQYHGDGRGQGGLAMVSQWYLYLHGALFFQISFAIFLLPPQ